MLIAAAAASCGVALLLLYVITAFELPGRYAIVEAIYDGFFFFFLPFYYLRPSCSLSLLGVTQIRDHIGGS